MSVTDRMARNAGLLTVARAGSLGLNFVVWVHLARMLAPERYGVIGFGLALVSYFVLIVTLGIDMVGIREIARARDRVSELVSDVVSLRLLLGAAAGVAYLATVWLLPQPPLYRLVLSALGLQILVRAFQLDWVFVAVERVSIVAVREFLASLLMAAGVLVLVRSPEAVVLAAILVTGAPLASTVAMWVQYRRDYGPVRLRGRRAGWATILRPSLPLAASALMIEVYTNLDRLMLEAFRPTAEVGWYTAAYKAATFGLVPTTVLYAVFFPFLSSALGDPAEMAARGRAYARALYAFGAPVALAAPFLATPAMTLVFGEAYAVAGPALALLLANVGVMYLNMSLGTPLMAWDLQTPYMWTVIAGAVANVFLNFALIPPYGMEGAAIATLASESVVFAGLVVLYRRTTGATPFGLLWRAVAAALVGAVPPAAWAAHAGWPVLAGVGASVLGYAATAWAFGVVDGPWIRRMLRRSPEAPL